MVTLEQNETLMRPMTQEEVDQATKSMPLGKAPGPDGFTTDLFHHCWDLVRKESWEVVEESHTSGQVLLSLNVNFLTLIRKEEMDTNLKQFRPISLCNMIYKIITKVVANSLKPIMTFIISKEQARYMEGIQIMYTVILSHEVIHSLNSTKAPSILIKLDLSKYFDKASWQYLQAILDSFGLDQH